MTSEYPFEYIWQGISYRTDFTEQHELNTYVRRVEGIYSGVVGGLDVLHTLLF